MPKKKLRVLSPDGFDIERDKTYKNDEEAKNAIQEFIKRYEHQGYYSSMRGRISLTDLESCCRTVPA